MKKSNKVTLFYIISSIVLLLTLAFAGGYGIYLSVGLKFVRSSVSNFTEGMQSGTGNVSFGGSVNYKSSMVGVIILSIALIVLAIFDVVSLIKQIIFFKQFKAVKNSKIEQKIEKKTKSKGKVLFFVFVIDILSLVAGIAGIFINSKCFTSGNFVWIMYTVDALVALFSLVSMILLIIKLKQAKSIKEKLEKDNNMNKKQDSKENLEDNQIEVKIASDVSKLQSIDELENKLIKLKYLRSAKLISPEEYNKLRNSYFASIDEEKKQEK